MDVNNIENDVFYFLLQIVAQHGGEEIEISFWFG